MDALWIIVGALILVLVLWWRRSDTGFHSSASSLQAIITAVAILIAGYWYFVERKGQPHANMTQTVEVHRISEDLIAVEVHMTVENLGSRLLSLRRARVRIQQVSPPRYNMGQLLGRSGQRLWGSRWVEQGGNVSWRAFSGSEFNWPIIEEYNGGIVNDLEPGEKDLIVASFFVNCGADTLRVASAVEKERSGDMKPMMWKARSFANLKPACSLPEAPELKQAVKA